MASETHRNRLALPVPRSIASAFEHTKEALLASSHPEAGLVSGQVMGPSDTRTNKLPTCCHQVADQSNAFLLLTNHERLEGAQELAASGWLSHACAPKNSRGSGELTLSHVWRINSVPLASLTL